MSYHPAWPEEQCAALRFHILGGNLSYSGIAAALNNEFGTHYSRNAAIGRAARMNLRNPYYHDHILSAPKAPRKPQVYKPRPKRPRSFIPIETARLQCAEIVPGNVSLIDIDDNGCRYPVNEISPFLFCNHRQLEGSSYCPGHYHLSVGQGTSSERRANQMVAAA